jgi:hypothetical protein
MSPFLYISTVQKNIDHQKLPDLATGYGITYQLPRNVSAIVSLSNYTQYPVNTSAKIYSLI